SVLIPSRNQGQFLVHTLATIAKQDFADYEVVIQDARSTDMTADVVRAYSELPISYVSERDAGQLDGVERAWRRAKGEICLWLNADDVILPGAFAAAAAAFLHDPGTDIVFGNSYWFNYEHRTF